MIAQDVVSRFKKLMLDYGSTPRFSDADLLEFFNDAPAAILGIKPSARVVHNVLTLQAGAKQSLPEQTLFLHDITFNEGGAAIRYVDRAQLDQFVPGWRQGKTSIDVKHFMYDEVDPKTFWVYPPNDGQGRVMVQVTDLPEGITSLDDELPLSDEYLETYLYYLAYRAFDWDGDEPTNAERSQLFYQKMAGTLGVKMRTSGAVTRKES